MTKEDTSSRAANKSTVGHGAEKEKSERQRGLKKEKLKAPTKVIVRHLPPTMTEAEFLQQIDPLPDNDFYYFAAADWSLGYDATCRAYITLKHYDDVFLFRDRFDGYVFVDSKGAEYPAIVEFAPFQGLPKNKSRRTDSKVNMIEKEEHYQQFLQKLQEDREAASKGGECKLEFSLDRKKEEKITSTPLLQYLANKKEKRREEAKKRAEEKRRQRDEDKEKRRQTQTQSQPQVTKIYAGKEGSQKDGKATAAGSKENVGDKSDNVAQENYKNARSKRRIERDRRRREEHEQRKKERERLEQDRKDRAPAKPEKRRERNRNRKDKEKEKETGKELDGEGEEEVKESEEQMRRGEAVQESIKANTAIETEEIAQDVAATPVQEEGKVSDSVMTFIRSAVTATEFVPRHKQEQKAQEEQKKARQQESTAKETVVNEVKDKSKGANAAEDGQKHGEDVEKKRTDNVPASRTTGGKQTQRQRLVAEDMRIRNKDRPSIAIYQPKVRTRVSEESDTSASKDVRSNPASDCESSKKEEPRSKKVSRYSERRSERRSNRDKHKSSESGDGQETSAPGGNHEDATHAEHDMRPAKSDDWGEDTGVELEQKTIVEADTLVN